MMDDTIMNILIWLGGMALLIAILPKERAERVTTFVKSVLRLMPLAAMVRAWKGDTDKEDKEPEDD